MIIGIYPFLGKMVTDIEHILYNTIGTTFEEFLTGEDLVLMSQVSKTTREGTLNRRFREILECYRMEEKIYRNNSGDFNGFLVDIPARSIFKDIKLPDRTEIEKLLDYINAGETERIMVSIEYYSLDELKKIFQEVVDLEDGGKYEYFSQFGCPIFLYQGLLAQASIRLRPDICKYLFDDPAVSFDSRDTETYHYYGITEELRSLYIQYQYHDIVELRKEFNFNDDDDYAMMKNNWDRAEFFSTTLLCALRCRDKDLFCQYYRKVYGDMDPDIEKLFDDIACRYTID